MNFKKKRREKACLDRTEDMPSLFFLGDVTCDRPSENVEFPYIFHTKVKMQNYQANIDFFMESGCERYFRTSEFLVN